MSPADTRDPVPLLATTYGQCRLIVAEWPQPLCGGAPSAAGHSWCSMHRQVVYVPTRTKGAAHRREIVGDGCVLALEAGTGLPCVATGVERSGYTASLMGR